VVVIKRTQQIFLPHKATYYRDKKSVRNGLQNDQTERPAGPELKKFWEKRFYLFSKFDKGIKIDDESWYSITPEPLAKHIAQRVIDMNAGNEGNLSVLDAFCGVGGNLIQFARKCGFCVGSDMDPLKAQYCKHNAELYNLASPEQFQVVHSDFLKLSNNMKIPHFTFPEGKN